MQSTTSKFDYSIFNFETEDGVIGSITNRGNFGTFGSFVNHANVGG
jgi:hypothetical protein